jgi:hypothetical protein
MQWIASSETFAPVSELISTAIPGYADVYERMATQGCDLDAITAEFERHAGAQGLAVPAARGVPASLRLLAERLSRRTLVQELGPLPASVEWMTLHVPKPGKASIEWIVTGERSATVNLTLVAGAGRGCRTAWKAQRSLPMQSECVRFVQHMEVGVREYQRDDGTLEHQLDVVAPTGQEFAEIADCALCSTPWESIDSFEFRPDEFRDLRGLSSSVSESLGYTVASSRTVEVGMPLPPPLSGKIGMTLKHETYASCEVKCEFAGGHVYRPYRLLDDPGAPPFWPQT